MATTFDGATRVVLPHRDVDTSRQTLLISAYSVATGLGLSAVALRLFTRVKIIGKMGKDDWIMCVVGVVDILYLMITMLGTRYGMALHVADWKPEWFEPAFKLLIPVQMLYFFNLCLVKISILLFYLRLATTASIRGFKRIINWTVGILTAFCVTGEIGMICQCIPISDYWNPSKPVSKKRCINSTAFFYFTSVSHIVLDLWLLALPSKLLFRVQRPLTQQLLLLGIFTIGILATICSCCRLYSILEFTQSDDPLWDGVPIKVWSCVELNLAIICACAPSFKAFITTKSRKNSDVSCTTCGSLDPNVSVLAHGASCSQCLRRVSTARTVSTSQSSGGEDISRNMDFQKGNSPRNEDMVEFRKWGVASANLDQHSEREDDNSHSVSIPLGDLNPNPVDDIEAQRNADNIEHLNRPRTSSMTMPDPEFFLTTFSNSPDDANYSDTRPATADTDSACHRTHSLFPILRSKSEEPRRTGKSTQGPLQALRAKIGKKTSSLVDVCHSIPHSNINLRPLPQPGANANRPIDPEMGLMGLSVTSRSRVETRCTRGSMAIPPDEYIFESEGSGGEGPSNLNRERQASRIICRRDFRVESDKWEAVSL